MLFSVFNYTDRVELSLPLGELCSVFQAEVYAILQCAQLDALGCRNDTSIAICSDSQAALKSLQAAKVTSALVAETMAALKELAIFNTVQLVWVPGHSGTPGNEEANRLARLASLTSYIRSAPVLGVRTTEKMEPDQDVDRLSECLDAITKVRLIMPCDYQGINCVS